MPLTNVTGLPSSSREAAAIGNSWRVNLELLTSAGVQREGSFISPRNIFAVPRPDGSLLLSHDQESENRQDSSLDEIDAEQAEKEESAPYRYLGFLRMGESRQINKDLAVVKKGDEVMVLKIGDHVDEHVILRAITTESVIMRDTGTKTEQAVPLSEETAEQE